MMNWGLKNKFILIIAIYFSCLSVFGQNCELIYDSSFVEDYGTIGLIGKSNCLLSNYNDYEIVIVYYTVGSNGENYKIIYQQNNMLFLSKDLCTDVTPEIYDTSFVDIFGNQEFSLKGSFFIYSEVLSREKYDFLYVKYYYDIFEIIPTGTLIFENLDCIRKSNKSLYNFLYKLQTLLEI